MTQTQSDLPCLVCIACEFTVERSSVHCPQTSSHPLNAFNLICGDVSLCPPVDGYILISKCLHHTSSYIFKTSDPSLWSSLARFLLPRLFTYQTVSHCIMLRIVLKLSSLKHPPHIILWKTRPLACVLSERTSVTAATCWQGFLFQGFLRKKLKAAWIPHMPSMRIPVYRCTNLRRSGFPRVSGL